MGWLRPARPARRYGCRVTTTTISKAQYEFARERIERAGLGARVTLLLEDYRDLKGRYDKLASIEMIEAVELRATCKLFFARCSALLASHGAMLLQAITIQDQLYEQALHSVDYIQRYIFPGSFIPSGDDAGAAGDLPCWDWSLKLFHLEDIGPHYARTLALWRRNFFAHLDLSTPPWLSRQLRSHVGLLSVLLRGWFRRTAVGRCADVADETSVSQARDCDELIFSDSSLSV